MNTGSSVALSSNANKQVTQLRKGDVVEVRSAQEILATLDHEGMVDGLPFMPEMIPLIGKQFKVSRRAEKTCMDYPDAHTFRKFRDNDVVFLEDLRCSGEAHGDCQRGCSLFWKEAWLRKVSDTKESKSVGGDTGDTDELRKRLKTKGLDGRFICQSSMLETATDHLPVIGRLKVSITEVQVGNRTLPEMFYIYLKGAFWKLISKTYGKHGRGTLEKTPAESLDLQPGEWVEVKSYGEICKTIDKMGKNRGLTFEQDMRLFCGKKFRVRKRLDRFIREDNGHIINLTNTVFLEGVNCHCVYATGGCPRAEPYWWREIWLKRVSPPMDKKSN